MFIRYVCKQCGKEKILSKAKDIDCPDCNIPMEKVIGIVSSEIMTFEEDRFMAEEALFNSIGNRVGKKSAQGSTGN